MDLEALNPDSVEEIFARHGANSISFSGAGERSFGVPVPLYFTHLVRTAA